jgi:hypothetical protein
MTELLCNVFRTVIATTPGDLLPVVYLVANKVAPAHEGVELGIGEATLIKALAEATGRKEAQIKLDMKVAWSPSSVRFLLVSLRLLADSVEHFVPRPRVPRNLCLFFFFLSIVVLEATGTQILSACRRMLFVIRLISRLCIEAASPVSFLVYACAFSILTIEILLGGPSWQSAVLKQQDR